MPIRSQYSIFYSSEQASLKRLRNISIGVTLFSFVLMINYIIFNRDDNSLPTDANPLPLSQISAFVILCDLYSFFVLIANLVIFKWEKNRRLELYNTLGNTADYGKVYLQIFRTFNFSLLICSMIRMAQKGLIQWFYQLCCIVYGVSQLCLARLMIQIQKRMLKAETDLQKMQIESQQELQ